MARKEKDYWNWTEITIPYNGDWKKFHNLEKLCLPDDIEVRVTTDYIKPRKRYSVKVITHYHYFVKDPAMAMWIALHQ